MSNIFVSDRKIELSAKCFRVASTKGHKSQHPTVPETIKFNITHGFPKIPKSFWLSFEATMSRNTRVIMSVMRTRTLQEVFEESKLVISQLTEEEIYEFKEAFQLFDKVRMILKF
ncbi:hypothetical protein CRE_26030 [Caenorhabditis remanei]|uniref:Uncharacterized protein n=1 Tax=Caenorhabditis remanei TaxID=31234 RepID=E3NVF5_CAERE|nr:hypothetical protein CRE_26030 [Caenorhabditis remanei]